MHPPQNLLYDSIDPDINLTQGILFAGPRANIKCKFLKCILLHVLLVIIEKVIEISSLKLEPVFALNILMKQNKTKYSCSVPRAFQHSSCSMKKNYSADCPSSLNT